MPSLDRNSKLDSRSSNDIAAIPNTSGDVQEIIDWFKTKVITLCTILTIMNHFAPENSIFALAFSDGDNIIFTFIAVTFSKR